MSGEHSGREVIAEGSEEARGPIHEERSVLKQHVGGYGDSWRCGRCLDICHDDYRTTSTYLLKGMEKYAVSGLSAIQLFVINDHMQAVRQRYEDIKAEGRTREIATPARARSSGVMAGPR